jgi:hypothetical protein
MPTLSSDHLRRLRNDIPVDAVINELPIATGRRWKRRTFQCPACGGFHTATNPRVNLARCFRCGRNYNPIDLVIAARGVRFLDAVRYLEDLARRGGWRDTTLGRSQ